MTTRHLPVGGCQLHTLMNITLSQTHLSICTAAISQLTNTVSPQDCQSGNHGDVLCDMVKKALDPSEKDNTTEKIIADSVSNAAKCTCHIMEPIKTISTAGKITSQHGWSPVAIPVSKQFSPTFSCQKICILKMKFCLHL